MRFSIANSKGEEFAHFDVSTRTLFILVIIFGFWVWACAAGATEAKADSMDQNVQICAAYPTWTPEHSDHIRKVVITNALASLGRHGPISPASEECVAEFAANMWAKLDEFCKYEPIDPIGYVIGLNHVDDTFIACHTAASTPKE